VIGTAIYTHSPKKRLSIHTVLRPDVAASLWELGHEKTWGCRDLRQPLRVTAASAPFLGSPEILHLQFVRRCGNARENGEPQRGSMRLLVGQVT
jgi:hypothetical protein